MSERIIALYRHIVEALSLRLLRHGTGRGRRIVLVNVNKQSAGEFIQQLQIVQQDLALWRNNGWGSHGVSEEEAPAGSGRGDDWSL